MARVTVEDCLRYVDNRFQLVHISSERARQLDDGYLAKIEHTGDKSTVLALREIAEGKIDKDTLLQQQSRLFDETDQDAKSMEENLRDLARKELADRKSLAASMQQGYENVKPIANELTQGEEAEDAESVKAKDTQETPLDKEKGEVVEGKVSVTQKEKTVKNKAVTVKKSSAGDKDSENKAVAAPKAEDKTAKKETSKKSATSKIRETKKK